MIEYDIHRNRYSANCVRVVLNLSLEKNMIDTPMGKLYTTQIMKAVNIDFTWRLIVDYGYADQKTPVLVPNSQ